MPEFSEDATEVTETQTDKAPQPAQHETEQSDKVDTPDGFIALDKHQKDVNVQHKKFRDEERGHHKAVARAEKAEKELADLRAGQAAHEVPPPPDPHSDTYAADIATRDDAIRQQADHDAAVKKAEDDQLREKEASAAHTQELQRERVTQFDANMLTLGLDPVGTKAAADTIIEYGIDRNLEDFILEDPDGPLLVTYLAKNPVELDQLKGLSAYQLSHRLNDEIRAKASLLKPKTSNAPPPPTTVTGGGVPESKESWEAGAKYE